MGGGGIRISGGRIRRLIKSGCAFERGMAASSHPASDQSNLAAYSSGDISRASKVNGGLYTGERFAGDWGNVPIDADAGSIANRREFRAFQHAVSTVRPGNNSPTPETFPTRSFDEYGLVAPQTDEWMKRKDAIEASSSEASESSRRARIGDVCGVHYSSSR